MKIRNEGERKRLANKQRVVLEYIQSQGWAGPLAFKVWRGPILALIRRGRLFVEWDGRSLSYEEVVALKSSGPGFRIWPVP